MTVQEDWWKGDFGSAYLTRNRVDWRRRKSFWQPILDWVEPDSVLEIGTNAGWNLRAIRDLRKDIELKGVDVNPDAIAEATAAGLDVEEMSALDVGSRWPNEYDLTLTSGVLIHIGPDHIHQAMESIIAASRKYVLAVEYAGKTEEHIDYRGHSDRLWRRPYGEMYEAMGLTLVDSGPAPNSFDRCHFWLFDKR